MSKNPIDDIHTNKNHHFETKTVHNVLRHKMLEREFKRGSMKLQSLSEGSIAARWRVSNRCAGVSFVRELQSLGVKSIALRWFLGELRRDGV